jgi:hypothetical protein
MRTFKKNGVVAIPYHRKYQASATQLEGTDLVVALSLAGHLICLLPTRSGHSAKQDLSKNKDKAGISACLIQMKSIY